QDRQQGGKGEKEALAKGQGKFKVHGVSVTGALERDFKGNQLSSTSRAVASVARTGAPPGPAAVRPRPARQRGHGAGGNAASRSAPGWPPAGWTTAVVPVATGAATRAVAVGGARVPP